MCRFAPLAAEAGVRSNAPARRSRMASAALTRLDALACPELLPAFPLGGERLWFR